MNNDDVFETLDWPLDYPIFEPIVFSHIVDEYSDAKYISLTRGYDDYVESVLKDKIKSCKKKHIKYQKEKY